MFYKDVQHFYFLPERFLKVDYSNLYLKKVLQCWKHILWQDEIIAQESMSTEKIYIVGCRGLVQEIVEMRN